MDYKEWKSIHRERHDLDMGIKKKLKGKTKGPTVEVVNGKSKAGGGYINAKADTSNTDWFNTTANKYTWSGNSGNDND